jgi:hypothetical protein
VISRRTGRLAGLSPHPEAHPPARSSRSTEPQARAGHLAFLSILGEASVRGRAVI